MPAASTSRARKLPIGVPTMLKVANSIGSALTSSTNIVEPLRKKALLIGINYPKDTDWHLKGPQNEVRAFKELLSTRCGYQDANIVVLTDEPGTPEECLPTRANILREIMKLTLGSSPGDEHFLLYSGHSAQREESEKREIPLADTTNPGTDSAVAQTTTNDTTTIANATPECSRTFAGTSLPNSLLLAEPATVQRQISTRTAHTAATIETTTLGLSEGDAIEADLSKFIAHVSCSDFTEQEEEEDGYDEYIIPLDAIGSEMDVVDEKIILDDILKQCLVGPLCPQAKLVVIFDCCHSATLLDLKHHRCHRIGTWPSRYRRFCRRFFVEPYVRFVLPFKSPALQKFDPRRRPEDTGDNNRPEEATDTTHPKPNLKNRPRSWFSGPETLRKKANAGEPALSPLPRQSSFNLVIDPRKRCSGLCARMDLSSLDRQHVVCVSACKDSQMGVEDKAGESMTQAIIDLLRENPGPTLRELMQAVNANTKLQRKEMKRQYDIYEKQVKALGQPIPQDALEVIEKGKVLCKNVQRPQISSSRSLDLRKTYLFEPSDVNAPDHGSTQGREGGQRFGPLRSLFRGGRARS